MMKQAWNMGAVALAMALAAWSWPSQAEACGGCFAPPTGTPTVVTGHRMAVALSATETTLWDQIQYAGDPADFVWVLPIAGTVIVELADNGFFEALDQVTQITMQGTFPPLQTFCPDPCFGGRGGPSLASGGDGSTTSPPVTVYGEAIVGPYETATIGSTDPTALVTWLRGNGYGVPDSILPVITHYVDLGMNFAVLRLSPNAGVNQMQPVRVTTPGLNPVFPLRMVAAGVEGKVGLQLYVFGEGRYEAQNFPVVEVDPRRLAYDWSTTTFNYDDVFDILIAENGGRAWVAEYARDESAFRFALERYDITADDGTRRSSIEDFAVVTRAIRSPYLTKLRTDLLASFLDQDLNLQADMAGGDVENFILVDNQVNRPDEPRCPTVCRMPGGGLFGGGTLGFSDGRGDGCAIAPGSNPVAPWALMLGVLGLAWARRRR